MSNYDFESKEELILKVIRPIMNDLWDFHDYITSGRANKIFSGKELEMLDGFACEAECFIGVMGKLRKRLKGDCPGEC